MIGVAYVSGGKVAQHYGEHIIYSGHEIYVASEVSGDIDGNPAQIVHIGVVDVDSFNIYAVYSTESIIVLDHSISGIVGSTMQVSMSNKKETFNIGEDINFNGEHFTYKGGISNILIYNINGIDIGVLDNTKTVITIGHTEYVITKITDGGETYIQIAMSIINKIATDSVVLLIMMAVVIYAIGEVVLWKVGERWE